LGSGSIGDYTENKPNRPDLEWLGTKTLTATIQRRCASCHRNQLSLPLTVSHDVQHVGRSQWPISRHTVFNLSHPEKSLMLLAPLSKAAGGYGLCQAGGIFTNAADPDYAAILAGITESQQKLEQMTRFDMPGFRPRSDWVREMKRFGILGNSVDGSKPIDVYAAERKYWESLWYRPE
jgi:hypothetical protein